MSEVFRTTALIEGPASAHGNAASGHHIMTQISSFKDLPLADPLKRVLESKNYDQPTPVQSEAIPAVLSGTDLLVSAQTGTGKTAAFALPILTRLHDKPWKRFAKGVRTLVLVPTRELAHQVADNFSIYGTHIKFGCLMAYGGVSIRPQIRGLRQGVDVLVATPGRLIDLFEQGEINFSELDCFVLDEADRMLDMGFINDVEKIINLLPTERQSLFFSATMNRGVSSLASGILKSPREIVIQPDQTTAEKVDHQICYLHQDDKLNLISIILDEFDDKNDQGLILIFTRTRLRAERLSKSISRDGYAVETIHGNKTQAARQKALDKFKQGRANILVATDVAARGIDVKNITLVINYDIPEEPDSYVHRIGRTARGGKTGLALTFCTRDNLKDLAQIIRFIKSPIPAYTQHPYHLPELAEKAVSEKRGGKSDGRSRNGSSSSSKPRGKKDYRRNGSSYDDYSSQGKPHKKKKFDSRPDGKSKSKHNNKDRGGEDKFNPTKRREFGKTKEEGARPKRKKLESADAISGKSKPASDSDSGSSHSKKKSDAKSLPNDKPKKKVKRKEKKDDSDSGKKFWDVKMNGKPARKKKKRIRA